MNAVAGLRIRAVDDSEGDVGLLFDLICELAEYERREVEGDAALLRKSLFEEDAAKALLFEVDQKPVGYAIYLKGFSSFGCRSTLWLEDLYIRPEHRGSGIGRQVMIDLGRRAIKAGLDRIEWHVLGWNDQAIEFYGSLGAQCLTDWRTFKLEEEQIRSLVESA
jgi:GNAT superfamily N-acetyltransferase